VYGLADTVGVNEEEADAPARAPWPPVRMPVVAVSMAAGIAASSAAGPWAAAPRVWALALLVFVLAARWRGGARARAVAWIGAAALIGASLAARERARVPALPAAVAADDRAVDEITGVVDGPIAATRWGRGLRVDLDGADARVWVTVDGPTAALPGDRIRASGRLRTPRGYRDPGAVDRAAVARNRGVDLELGADRVEVIEPAARATAWRSAAAWQRGASAWVARRGGDAAGNAVVRGAVLGDRSAIAPAVDDAWRAAGVYHVLSVSGLHLAVVALLSFALLRRGLAMLAGARVDPTPAAAGAAAAIAIAYTLVTGAEVATVRALVVALAVLGGAALARRARLADALGLAAVLVLAHTPSALVDPSFQLSFAATAALVVLPRRPRPIEPVPPWPRRAARAAVRWVVRGLVASAWVTAVTAPITALHFHQIAVGGIVGNLVVTPLVELLVIPLALAGLVLPVVGGPLMDVAVGLCGAAHRVAAGLASWTPVIPVPPPRPLELIALGVLAVAWLRWRQRRAGARDAILAAAAAVALAASVGGSIAAPRWSTTLRATFLDVGQGDAAVIEAPGGEVWLIDAGGVPFGPPNAGPGEAVARFLAARRIRRIDVAIVSHPHPDHYLGLLALAGRVPIGELWIAAPAPGAATPATAAPPAVASFESVAAALTAAGTRVVHPPLGEARRAGGAVLRVLAPIFDPGDSGTGALAVASADPVRSVNDDSLVVAVEHAGRRLLFLGDIEAEGEDRLVSLGGPAVRADVVKVPHHGSPTSSSAALVDATRPALAVISCGVANRFGFPSGAVVARWGHAGARVARTDRDGAITVAIDQAGAVAVETYR